MNDTMITVNYDKLIKTNVELLFETHNYSDASVNVSKTY